MNLIACNDDALFGAPCFTYSSKLEDVALQSGMTYYVIIDGYGSAAGAYQMDITVNEPCAISSTRTNRCGVSGWYIGP